MKIKAVAAIVIGLALTAASFVKGDATTTQKADTEDVDLFVLYPGATPYVQEINGNLAVSFVHNFGPHHEFGGIAYDTEGKSVGNWNNDSVANPGDQPQDFYLEGSKAPLMLTTVYFKDFPLNKLKKVTLFAFEMPKDKRVRFVMNPMLSLGEEATMPKPGRAGLTENGRNGMAFTTPEGLSIVGSGSSQTMKTEGKLIEVRVAGGTVKSAKGEILLEPGIEMIYTIDPSRLPSMLD